MGIIITMFKRKKKSTLEVLDGVDTEIKHLEGFTKDTEQRQKRIIGSFIIFSVFLYLIAVVVVYFYYFPRTIRDRLVTVGLLILGLLILLFIKRILTWYYNRKIKQKRDKLQTLKLEKKELLDKVMDTEIYKVAKTILEKYSPDAAKKIVTPEFTTPAKPIVSASRLTTGLRQRPVPSSVVQSSYVPTEARLSLPLPLVPSTPLQSSVRALPDMRGPPIRFPRSILPKERTVFDRMVDYLVGDGPSHRNALICSNCFGHNGMAFPEEYEYLAYHCCYCHFFNPAKKSRTMAPKLEINEQPPKVSSTDSNSSDDENSSTTNSRSDNDEKAVLFEDEIKIEKATDDESDSFTKLEQIESDIIASPEMEPTKEQQQEGEKEEAETSVPKTDL